MFKAPATVAGPSQVRTQSNRRLFTPRDLSSPWDRRKNRTPNRSWNRAVWTGLYFWRFLRIFARTKEMWRHTFFQNWYPAGLVTAGKSRKPAVWMRGKSWSELILLRAARWNFGFTLLKWNFSLTKHCKTKEKNQLWNKRNGYSPNRRVFMWLYWLNFAGLQFCEIWFFLQCWHAVRQNSLLSSVFSVHVCFFLLSFIF